MFNKVILLGNLTRAVELQYLQNATALGKTAIAVNNHYINSVGAKVDETMYIDCTFWGKTAENANKYLRTGSKLLLEGSLMFEQWVDQNGMKRSKHSLKVSRMEMLDSKPQVAAPTQGGVYPPIQQTVVQTGHPTTHVHSPQPEVQQPVAQYAQPTYIPQIDIDEDEIPF